MTVYLVPSFYHTKTHNQMEENFKLGDVLVDKLTGFEGLCTARCEYLEGATQYHLVSPTLQDGEPVEQWFTHKRLRLT